MKKRIGDICTLKSGTTLKEDILVEDGPIPYVKVSDMNLAGNEKYIVTANSYVDENISEKLIFPKGTVLFPKRGGAIGTNKKRIASKSVCADLNTMGVIPSERIRPQFLYYFFKSIDFGTLYNGSSVPQINNTDIAPMEIDLPSLDEQDKALTQFEKVDFLIQKREEQLTKLDELIKARFVELFGDPIINPKGWKRCKFGDVVFYQEGPGVRNWQFRDSGVKLINIRNVINDSLDLSNTNNYLEIDEVETKYKHFLLNEGDYVMASSGVTWGKIAEVYKEHLPLCLNTSMIRIRPIDSNVICKKYLFHFIKSDGFRKQIERLITGSAQPNFGPSHLAKIDILVPDIELQQKFSLFTEQIDKSKLI